MGKHSDYIGVTYAPLQRSDKKWRAFVGQSKNNLGLHWQARFITEREAAIAVDKKRIELGLEPVNILKRK